MICLLGDIIILNILEVVCYIMNEDITEKRLAVSLCQKIINIHEERNAINFDCMMKKSVKNTPSSWSSECRNQGVCPSKHP